MHWCWCRPGQEQEDSQWVAGTITVVQTLVSLVVKVFEAPWSAKPYLRRELIGPDR